MMTMNKLILSPVCVLGFRGWFAITDEYHIIVSDIIREDSPNAKPMREFGGDAADGQAISASHNSTSLIPGDKMAPLN
jgi:hypothetical protein